ncbi:MAG: hypothetical protein LBJ08_01495 [Bifidobacteriaceae bacterium]|jgi:hypothetical protein|nr:hypothetical protein [Bifidobacteriaceae bacterium]
MSLDYYRWTEEMPLARISIQEDGSLSVWMMGIPRSVPPHLLHKDRMGLLLDHLYADRGGPYEVEVIDPDGSVHVGRVEFSGGSGTGLGQQAEARPEPTLPYSPVDSAWAPPNPDGLPNQRLTADVVIWEQGFIPGEPVIVAYVAGDMSATAEGQLGMSLSRQIVEGLPSREVILFGRQSATTVVCQPLGHP